MNILMVINNFYPFLGGTERQARALSLALQKYIQQITVVTRQVKGCQKQENMDGVIVYRLWSCGKGRLALLSFGLSLIVFLWKKRNTYQIIHCHIASPVAVIATLMGNLLHKKVILKLACGGDTFGDIEWLRKSPWLGNWQWRILKEKVDGFVALTEDISAELVNHGIDHRRIALIPNGVNCHQFAPALPKEKADLRRVLLLPEGIILIYTGNFYPIKRLDILLQAFLDLSKHIDEISLLLVGSGIMEGYIREFSAQHQLDSQIRIVGTVDNIQDYLKAADIFVLCSDAEGLSNSLLEAMGCGLAVVASAVGGNKEIIQDGINGKLFPPGDIEQLVQIILFLAKDPDKTKQLGWQARQTILAKCSMEKISKAYTDRYQQILQW
jgi:glycosyltransferase involved in cell wall biosynthesis